MPTIQGIPVTVTREIKFKDYMKYKYELDESRMGGGLQLLYADEYMEFCKDNGVEFEDKTYMKSCLTPKGERAYKRVLMIMQKMKEAKTRQEKAELETKLHWARDPEFIDSYGEDDI